MNETTIVLRAGTHEVLQDDQVRVIMFADYEDGRNKEWSAFTPNAQLALVLKDQETADRFPAGQSFLVTFTPKTA